MSESLGHELPKVMSHVRDKLIPMYQSIGSSGMFAVAMMRADLDAAQRAMIEGDVVAMIAAFQKLKEYKE